jgi:hydroxymethylbilane synthase
MSEEPQNVGMVDRTLRIGTRGSALALAQTELVAEALRAAGSHVEIVKVKTPGDQSTAPIAEIGVGVFTSALR